MRFAKLLSVCGMIAMTIALVNGFTTGNFAADGRQLLRNPWGVVSMVDLYTGFALFSAWVVFREKCIARALVWVALMVVLGFLTASIYVFFALQASSGDWQRFWMGRRADG
jgi:hypothetical protein